MNAECQNMSRHGSASSASKRAVRPAWSSCEAAPVA